MTTIDTPKGITQPLADGLLALQKTIQDLTPKTWKATKGLHWASRLIITTPVAVVSFLGTMFTAPTSALAVMVLGYIDLLFIDPIFWLKLNGYLAIGCFLAWLAFGLFTSGPLGALIVIGTDTEGAWRMADVIWVDGGARNLKVPTPFQVADVDTGVIRWINSDEVSEVIWSMDGWATSTPIYESH